MTKKQIYESLIDTAEDIDNFLENENISENDREVVERKIYDLINKLYEDLNKL